MGIGCLFGQTEPEELQRESVVHLWLFLTLKAVSFYSEQMRDSGDEQTFFLAIPSFSLLVLLFVFMLLNRSVVRGLKSPGCRSSPSLLVYWSNSD